MSDMNASEYEAFINVLMCADPWPYDPAWHTILIDYANAEAPKFGYDDWIEALHKIGEEAASVRQEESQFGAGG